MAVLRNSNDTPFDANTTQVLVYRAMMNIILNRIRAFLKQDMTSIRSILSGAMANMMEDPRVRKSNQGVWQRNEAAFEGANPTALNNRNEAFSDIMPMEWRAIRSHSSFEEDPRMIYAHSLGDYKRQCQESKLLKEWPQIRRYSALNQPHEYSTFGNISKTGIDGYPLAIFLRLANGVDVAGTNRIKDAIDAVARGMSASFQKALNRPGVSDVLDEFLGFSDAEGTYGSVRDAEATARDYGFRSGMRPALDDARLAPATNVNGMRFPMSNRGINADEFNRPPAVKTAANVRLLPLGDLAGDSTAAFEQQDLGANGAKYNLSLKRPQLFPMLDAAAILWNAREFFNPADCNRPAYSEDGNQDDQHYWCRIYIEAILAARELHKQKGKVAWEVEVKRAPGDALPTTAIGAMCDETWSKLFPLLPVNHPLRDKLRRTRALGTMWGTLPSYACGDTVRPGAWMPLAESHRIKLFRWVTTTYQIPMYDEKYRVPANPWCAHEGKGISRVYNQSYHSVYYCDSWRAPHFREWLKHACRYQPPRAGNSSQCHYPFSEYGGTPCEGDFLHHRVEAPHANADEARHRQLMYNRFGFTGPLRIGQQYHDTGLLQDLFQFEYRPHADLSYDQRQMPAAKAVYPSNFLAYARTHAVVALASCNHGTQEPSVPHIVRNLYRLYVDTYECMGPKPDDDGMPIVMGFLPNTKVVRKDDRPVIMYAGSLACLNTKLERFCSSGANRGEQVCQLYKQVYLNDATLLFTRLLKAERRKEHHRGNFVKARLRRGRDFTQERFNTELIELQDAYIEFLQTSFLGYLLETGANLNNAPLHMLEPRELEVSLEHEDTDVLGSDYLTPRTREIVKDMDFGGDTLSRQQLAILSLIPPNHRILGTLKLNQSTQIQDLEHIKKQIQKTVIGDNKKVWERYIDGLMDATLAMRLLEVDGPMDFGFDMSAIRDPLKESEGIRKYMTTTNAEGSSSLSQTVRGDKMKKDTSQYSTLTMNKKETERAISIVRAAVNKEYEANGGLVPKAQCLAKLHKVPEHVERMVAHRMQEMGEM